jgi:hypothetical protein
VAFALIDGRCCFSQAEEVRSEMVNVRAKAIFVQAGEDNDSILEVAKALNLTVLEIIPDSATCGIFTMVIIETHAHFFFF